MGPPTVSRPKELGYHIGHRVFFKITELGKYYAMVASLSNIVQGAANMDTGVHERVDEGNTGPQARAEKIIDTPPEQSAPRAVAQNADFPADNDGIGDTARCPDRDVAGGINDGVDGAASISFCKSITLYTCLCKCH